jgi:hypothetical protein
LGLGERTLKHDDLYNPREKNGILSPSVDMITATSPHAIGSITVKWIRATNDEPKIYQRNANGRWRGTYRPDITLPSFSSVFFPFNANPVSLHSYRLLNHPLLLAAKR